MVKILKSPYFECSNPCFKSSIPIFLWFSPPPLFRHRHNGPRLQLFAVGVATSATAIEKALGGVAVAHILGDWARFIKLDDVLPYEYLHINM